MEFIKKNYEKIILGAVMLGLVVVLAFMPFMIINEQQQMRDILTTYIPNSVAPLAALDMSRQQAVLKQLNSPYVLDFSTTNRLFNPVKWQRMSDGRIVKATRLGPNAAAVTKITPLYFSISLDMVVSEPAGPRYVFSIEDQAAPLPYQRRPRHRYASKGETVVDKTVGGEDQGFKLVDVKGAPVNPSELDLKLTDSQAPATVSKGKPYRRVDAYSADLKYEPEKFTVNGLRVGDHVAFAGDSYNVIAIDKTNVTLLAQSNQKKYNLPYTP
jgi:hypothetical protein